MKLRESHIEQMDDKVFDVLVVGGGINGAVSCASLSTKGASVALVDKGDFASLTSQESSNLVWGGIKYLEGMEFGLVRKLCHSRNLLISHYPSTVREIRFFVTLKKNFRLGRVFLYLGTLFYWLMGSFFTRPPRLLSNRIINRDEGQVQTEECAGGVEYSDAYLLDNDARFVFNFIKRAIASGAKVANYVESLGSTRGKDGIWSTEVKDLLSGRTFTIRSKALINACGPLADRYNEMSNIATGHQHLFSKGIHLLVEKITDSKRVLSFFADDGRLFFVIPMGSRSCLGTTDTRVDELPPFVTEEDRSFVLDNINKRLRLKKKLTRDDIIAERCGVRPLVVEPNGNKDVSEGDWSSLSRKHALEIDRAKKQLCIFGGKLTDCINVGDEVADAIVDLGIPLRYKNKKWYGEPSRQEKKRFLKKAQSLQLDSMTDPSASEPLSERYWRRYGMDAFEMLDEIEKDASKAEILLKGTEYTRCEIEYIAQREMVSKLEDFLRRRSKIALLVRRTEIENAQGLQETGQMLFGEQSQDKINEYFAS